jgi:hypothetical protein
LPSHRRPRWLQSNLLYFRLRLFRQ